MHIPWLHGNEDCYRSHSAVLGARVALRGDSAPHLEFLRRRTGGWIECHVLLAFDSRATRIPGTAGKRPRGRENRQTDRQVDR